MASKQPTISDELLALGFGHRANAHTRNTGQREVFNLKTGELAGCMTAHEACEWMAARRLAGAA